MHTYATRGSTSKRRLIMDRISVQPNAAFSCYRKLRTSYTGSAFRVRRSSDNTELDIGFRDRYVDLNALLAFCAGTSGFIRTLYDQSSNRDLAQGTSGFQPRIVNGGSLDTLSTGKVAIVFDGSDDRIGRLDVLGLPNGSPDCTTASSFSLSSTATVPYMVGGVGDNTTISQLYVLGLSNLSIGYANTQLPFATSPAASTPATWVHTHVAGGSVLTGGLRQNGNVLTVGTPTAGSGAVALAGGTTTIGSHTGGSFNTQMKLNAWMIFNAVLAGSDLTAIEAELALHAAA